MAVTVTLGSIGTSTLLPAELNSLGRIPSPVDTLSSFPTLPAGQPSRVNGPLPDDLVTLTTVQTFQTIETIQATVIPSTVVQAITVFVTETSTVQETLRQVVDGPVATQLPGAPQDTPVQDQAPDTPPNNAPPAAEPMAEPVTEAPTAELVVTPSPPLIPGSPPAQANIEMGDGPPVKDPANAQFFGGVPTKKLDLPITIVFLILFAIGAFLHITIYRRNAKRGHKFLLSDLMFDFCMIRVVTCIFRITWSIVSTRGVILIALITLNGGAVVIMAINVFFAQRIVRAVQPLVGWHPAFSKGTLFLVLTVPAIIILNVIALSVSFFSVGNEDRLTMVEAGLKFGSSWIVWLSVVPLVLLAGSLSTPGPPTEKFGVGPLRVKAAMVIGSSLLLATGAVIRLYTLSNPLKPGESNPMFSKPVFYLTGFTLEIAVVYLYAFARVDLLFHVPNGSSAPGDYSKATTPEKKSYTPEEIERLIDSLGVPYQILPTDEYEAQTSVYAVFFGSAGPGPSDTALDAEYIPPRPERVTRRQTVIDAVQPQFDRMSRYVDRR